MKSDSMLYILDMDSGITYLLTVEQFLNRWGI